jgi:REP element-mobilizing transposase RayT
MTLFKGKYRVESTRLRGWDYSSPGRYFVTICTKDRKLFFGDVIHAVMELSEIGKIAHQYWAEIPGHFPMVVLDEFKIMPNHVHGIVVITESANQGMVETRHIASLHEQRKQQHEPTPAKFGGLKPGSLSKIVQEYKSAVTRWCGKNGQAFGWQPGFYDHIIRNEKSLHRIRQYIRNNPAKWESDRDNPSGLYI